MSLSDNEVELLGLALAVYAKEKKHRKRKMWVRPTYLLRPKYGADVIFNRLRVSDPLMFKEIFRMTPEVFDQLLELVAPKIAPSAFHVREPIPTASRLAAALRYLVSGDQQRSIAIWFLISPSSMSLIICKVCNALWEVLRPHVLKTPTEAMWKDVAKSINERWQFPNCVGALDGKHVVIQAPKKSGSMYYNYKGSHSVVLLAACDANYKFTVVDIGAPGRNSDGGVFAASAFGQALSNGTLNLPPPTQIPSVTGPMPYVFVADAAFPLMCNVMRPFPGRSLSLDEQIYNYRHSRARRLIENSFGILSSRFRIFRKPIIAKVETVEAIVKATVCLHNFLKSQDENMSDDMEKYCPTDFVDNVGENGVVNEGAWRLEDRSDISSMVDLQPLSSHNYSNSNAQVRQNLKCLFRGFGHVPWQLRHVTACD